MSELSREEAVRKIGDAVKLVGELCSGGRKWTMSVPAQPDYDPDLVIGGALHAALRALSQPPDSPQAVQVMAKGSTDGRETPVWILPEPAGIVKHVQLHARTVQEVDLSSPLPDGTKLYAEQPPDSEADLDYAIALQRAIEAHCRGETVTPELAQKCPFHAAKLNANLVPTLPDSKAVRQLREYQRITLEDCERNDLMPDDTAELLRDTAAHLARQPAAQSPVREGDVQMTDGLGNVTVYSYDHLGIPHKVGQPAAQSERRKGERRTGRSGGKQFRGLLESWAGDRGNIADRRQPAARSNCNPHPDANNWDRKKIKDLCQAAAEKEAASFVSEYIEQNLQFSPPALRTKP